MRRTANNQNCISRLVGTFLLFLLLSPLLSGGAMAANVLKYDTLALAQMEGKQQVSIDLRSPVKYKYFTLQNPDRLVVDLKDTVLRGKKAALDHNSSAFKSLRAGIRKGTDLRLVFDLKPGTRGSVSVDGKKLIVDFKGGPAAGKAVAKKTDNGKAGAKQKITQQKITQQKITQPKPIKKSVKPIAAAPKPIAVVKPSKPQAPKASVAKISKPQAPKKIAKAPVAPKPVKPIAKQRVIDIPKRDIVVAIDAGHGGVDPGALGRKGTKEKDVVMAIARQLEALVKKQPGMKPLMIRDGDYFLSLSQRMNKARNANADIFISIHADAFPDRRARGSSVYTLSERGETSAAAKLLAERENAADLFGTVALDEVDESLASILVDMSQSATIEASMDVAGRVLKGLKGVGHVHKRQVQQAGFAVLKSPDIPSILIETAFISNPKEEQQLRSRKHQKKMANAILQGVRSYFAANPIPGSRVATAREHVIKRGDTLSAIAMRYQVSARSLRRVNNLKSDRIRIGQVLQIPIGS